eukprot:CAMPEP_0179429170 /NCGR_PEP_ID=MMETSP0799-20121207/14629_1 /TAXON_ID=46947 /ORGANISM="Geminigera cryophila, Strain CCMP2564" /LENGTH=242 /DNA_ID=CAMNT_0021204971 /DNA_START=507 /DNA_END=1231 /DNA_ORIENTATION=-
MCLDPPPPWASMHRTDVSDSHSVPSHPVCPARAPAVMTTSPRPAPCTVTKDDPVAAAVKVMDHAHRDSIYRHFDAPSPSTLVSRQDDAPSASSSIPIMHRTEVSDSHSVPSQPVCAPRPMAVKADTLQPAPCTVTDADPVPAILLKVPVRRLPTSAENICDMLPARAPTVIKTFWVFVQLLLLIMHVMAVLDDQPVASHPVCPCRARPVYAIFPMLAPYTVTVENPVGCWFKACMMLKPGTS